MAQSIDLQLRVRTQGEQSIQQLIDQLKQMKLVLGQANASPLSELKKTFIEIRDSVREVASTVQTTVNSVVSQTRNAAKSTIDNITQNTSAATERLYTRVSAAVLTTISFAGQSTVGLFVRIVQLMNSTSSTIGKQVSKLINNSLDLAKKGTNSVSEFIARVFRLDQDAVQASTFSLNKAAAATTQIGQSTSVASNALKKASEYSSTFLGSVTFLGQFLSKVANLGIGLTVARVVLGEFTLFFRRLRGDGIQSLSLLERVTKLVGLLDNVLSSANLQLGQIFRTIGLIGGAAALYFFGPIQSALAFIPGINSFISNLSTWATRGKAQFQAFFGSGTAVLQIIFLDLKKLAITALPAIVSLAKQFSLMQGQASGAAKEVNKIGASASQLQSFGRTKLPFSAQFQIFATEIKQFLTEIFQLVAQIFVSISSGLQKTQTGAKSTNIESITANALSNVEKSGKLIDKVFDRGSLKEVLSGAETLQDRVAEKTKSFIGTLTKVGLVAASVYGVFSGSWLIPATIGIVKLISLTTKIPQLFKDIGQTIKGVWRGISESISGVFSGIWGTFKSIGGFFKGIGSGISSVYSGIKQGISGTSVGKIASLSGSAVSSVAKGAAGVAKVVAAPADSPLRKSVTNFGSSEKPIPIDKPKIAAQTKEIDNYIQKIQELLAFEKILERKIVSGKQFDSSKQINYLQALINGIMNSLAKEFSQKHFDKIVNTFLISFGLAFSSVSVPKDLAARIAGLIQQTIDAGAKAGVSPSKAVGQTFSKVLTESLKPNASPELKNAVKGSLDAITNTLIASVSNLKKSGEKIPQALSQGMKAGQGFVTEAAASNAQEIMDHNMQSPAKKGALRNILKSGSLIPKYLADGIRQGIGHTKKSAGEVAENIADHFPRSLPALGALVKIVSSGALIPYYLAKGILQGIGFVTDAVGKVATFISTRIEGAAKIGEVGERIGVSASRLSALDSVMATVGGSATDLEFSFTKINETLSKTLSPEEEAKFRKIGINLDEIRQSNEPNVALFSKISDVVKDLPPDSERFKMALELIGVTANSIIVNLLRKGSGGINELQELAVKLGLTFDGNFAKNAKQFQVVKNTITKIKDTILNDFIGAILPNIVLLGNKILEVVAVNRSRISAVLRIVGEGVALVFKLFTEFIDLAISEPEKALQVFFDVGNSVIELTSSVLDQVLGLLKGRVGDALQQIGIFIISVPFRFVKAAFDEIYEYVTDFSARIIREIVISMDRQLKNLPGGKYIADYMGLSDLAKQFEEQAIHTEKDLSKRTISVSRMFKTAVDEVKKDVEELSKATSSGKAELIDPKVIAKAKENINKFIADMRNSFSGTEMQGTFDKLVELLNQNRFEEVKQQIDEIKEAQIEAIKETTEAHIEGNEKRAESDAVTQEKQERADREARERAINIGTSMLDLQIRGEQDEFARMELQNQLELLQLQKRHEEEYLQLQNFKASEAELEIATEMQIAERKALIESQHRKGIMATMDFSQQTASGIEGIFSELYEATGKKMKAFFFAAKAAAIAEATIGTAKAVIQALGSPFPFNMILPPVAAAAGAIQVGKIVASTIQGFATGGSVTGGSGTKDDVPALLTAGEFVQPTAAVRYYGAQTMEAIRKRLIPRDLFSGVRNSIPNLVYSPNVPKFAEGGFVGQMQEMQKNSPASAPPIVVNLYDQRELQKFMASSAGRDMFINHVANNSGAFRQAMGS